MNITHPAHEMPFDILLEGLEVACKARYVYYRHDEQTNRTLYCYTKACVYERGWNRFTILARGLILDIPNKRIIAYPFPKFFNLGENGANTPDLPFEAFEKVDGSLVIIHHDGEKWRAATKGSLDSKQSILVENLLIQQDTSSLIPGNTYLCEIIHPDNRIVISYSYSGLVLLGIYEKNGREFELEELNNIANIMQWKVPERYNFKNMEDLLKNAKGLPVTQEGFVVRFKDGTRLKIKGSEYCMVHAMIARCTPLAIWEMMVAGNDLESMRRLIPEEFWSDFDSIGNLLNKKITIINNSIKNNSELFRSMTDKELAMSKDISSDDKKFLFSFRKSGYVLKEPLMSLILNKIRPDGNILEGYTPSYAINHASDD